MFQSQQNTAARGGPLGANRLQNGKMGEETAVTVPEIWGC